MAESQGKENQRNENSIRGSGTKRIMLKEKDSQARGSDLKVLSSLTYKEGEDHIQRALKNIWKLQSENERLRGEIEQIKRDPTTVTMPIQKEIQSKINCLREENSRIQSMIEQAQIPKYCEMNKKNVHDERKFMTESIGGSAARFGAFDDSESYIDKNDATSTCLNYGEDNQSFIERAAGREDAVQRRVVLENQIRLMLRKAEIFEEQLDLISKKETNQLRKRPRRSEASNAELARVEQYKRSLLQLLKKLRNREQQMSQMVLAFRDMYNETLRKLKQSTEVLQELQNIHISEDIDKKYAEVVMLQEQMQVIKQQLQRKDHDMLLKEIMAELASAVDRLGIQLPKNSNCRETIDELCEILIECNLSCRKDSVQKINMLKQYHQDEKKSYNKIVQALKAKEQALGKKLLDLQLQK